MVVDGRKRRSGLRDWRCFRSVFLQTPTRVQTAHHHLPPSLGGVYGNNDVIITTDRHITSACTRGLLSTTARLCGSHSATPSAANLILQCDTAILKRRQVVAGDTPSSGQAQFGEWDKPRIRPEDERTHVPDGDNPEEKGSRHA